jgi:hypothetical protein
VWEREERIEGGMRKWRKVRKEEERKVEEEKGYSIKTQSFYLSPSCYFGLRDHPYVCNISLANTGTDS